MESTGVYWKPIYYVLEEAVTCRLVNAAHIKQVPGRKTDVLDCVWIAQLLEHGLLRGSFVPPVPIRELRDLTRYRKGLIQERQREANRLHKVLQDAGIKLASVATNSLGVSGRAMLEALVGGTTAPEVLALREALAGRFRPHHAFLVSQGLAHLDYLDEGIKTRTAQVVIAEIGVDMSRFPSEHHLASWAGLCPGNNESAGKHKAGTTRKGNRWLRMALIEVALAAIRKKDSAFGARYRRVMRHRGHKKAVVAVAHSLLRTIYHVLAESTDYREPGADYYDRRQTARTTRRAVAQLERLGYRVTLAPAA